ncbi:Golgi complex component 7-domain-containing protein [Gorgonomyces haynaldii]|nr:Golgi complex component 7-domain-containing protein [Gorgonomyces haynaldii]
MINAPHSAVRKWEYPSGCDMDDLKSSTMIPQPLTKESMEQWIQEQIKTDKLESLSAVLFELEYHQQSLLYQLEHYCQSLDMTANGIEQLLKTEMKPVQFTGQDVSELVEKSQRLEQLKLKRTEIKQLESWTTLEAEMEALMLNKDFASASKRLHGQKPTNEEQKELMKRLVVQLVESMQPGYQQALDNADLVKIQDYAQLYQIDKKTFIRLYTDKMVQSIDWTLGMDEIYDSVRNLLSENALIHARIEYPLQTSLCDALCQKIEEILKERLRVPLPQLVILYQQTLDVEEALERSLGHVFDPLRAQYEHLEIKCIDDSIYVGISNQLINQCQEIIERSRFASKPDPRMVSGLLKRYIKKQLDQWLQQAKATPRPELDMSAQGYINLDAQHLDTIQKDVQFILDLLQFESLIKRLDLDQEFMDQMHLKTIEMASKCIDFIVLLTQPQISIWQQFKWQEQPQSNVPVFSMSPQQQMTAIGEFLLQLPQILDPLLPTDDLLSLNRHLPGLLQEDLNQVEPEDHEVVGYLWMVSIVRSVESKLESIILQIQNPSKLGMNQLDADLVYFYNVLSALDIDPSPKMQQVLETVKGDLEAFSKLIN